MSNIAMLLPRQTVMECANKVIEEDHRQVLFTKLVNNSNAVEEARAAMEAGAQILVARGLQALRIRERMDIPLVEISLTVQEIGLLIRRLKVQLNKEHPVIAIVHWENMFRNTEHLEELFEFELHTYFLKDIEEVPEKVEQAIREGADAIIGGITANQIALERGFPAIFADTSEDSIRRALDEAERIGQLADMERNNNAQLTAILDTSYNGIIKLNSSMEIVTANRMIEDAIGKKAPEIAGLPLEQVLPEVDCESVNRLLSGQEELFSGSMMIGNQLMIITGVPIWFQDRVGGAILTCKKVLSSSPAKTYQSNKKQPGTCAPGNFSMFRRSGGALRECLEQARAYACSSSPVLIIGETGTEKELLAESIHNNSSQKDGPFYQVDCGALSEEEQKALFLGRYNEKRGEWEKPGILQQNREGTIYLRQLEYLSLECQNLLVQSAERKMCWNGSYMGAEKRGGRILADMTGKPESYLEEGVICPELYYLMVLRLELPPLRQTRKEIPALARDYFQGYLEQYSKYMEIEPEGYSVLQEYDWSGNLTQLKHFCECLVLSSRKRRIRAGVVRELLERLYPPSESKQHGEYHSYRNCAEAQDIIEALSQTRGSRAQAAKRLGVSPTTLWRRMNKYGISRNFEK